MANISATGGIREEIGLLLNEEESTQTDNYTNWINQGLRDIQLSFPINPYYLTSADRTLSAGTRNYALPSDYEKFDSITVPSQDVTLLYISPEEYDLLQPSATEGGVPVLYTIRGQGSTGQIWYYPNGAYTVHQNYFRLPTTVSTGSSTPDLPTKYNELLVLFGVKKGMMRQGEFAQAREIGLQYEELKEKMKQEKRSLGLCENCEQLSTCQFRRDELADSVTCCEEYVVCSNSVKTEIFCW